MGTYMDDLQNRIDQERARAQQRKLQEEAKKALQAAQRAKNSRHDPSSFLLF